MARSDELELKVTSYEDVHGNARYEVKAEGFLVSGTMLKSRAPTYRGADTLVVFLTPNPHPRPSRQGG